MISLTSISSAGGMSKYMTTQAVTEYYAGQEVPSEWQGQGAEFQGLAGRPVEEKELTKQLQGKVIEFDKNTQEWKEKQLGVERGGELKHRAGWDFTFAPPKSVSMEACVYGRQDVIDALKEASKEGMRFLEENAAQSRVGGNFVQTGNLTYATFLHATSRAGDPQIHMHNIVSNVTYVDGKAYSLSNEKLLEWRTAADAVATNALAHKLQELGYGLEFNKSGSFEISGYTKEGLDAFSKRSTERDAALTAKGLDKDNASYEARQAAVLSTRNDKTISDSVEANQARWKAEAAGVTGAQQASRSKPKQGTQEERLKSAINAVQASIDHLSEREMAFHAREIHKEAARFNYGGADPAKLKEAFHVLIEDGKLIQREDGKFTTQEAIESEQMMGQRLAAGHGAHEAVMTGSEFEKALSAFEERNGFELTSEQRNAAGMILTGDDRFQGVQGLAGTGKTTSLKFVREAAESKGWEVKGFSNGGAQADKLQMESDIKSSTTAQHLIESEQLAKNANLAQRAISTYEKNIGAFAITPNFKELSKGVDNGTVKLDFDAEKRAYFTDKSGNTWTRSLYEKTTQIDSKNINHFGLTDTKYVITDKGVFKSGGGLGVAELAGRLKDNLNAGSKPATALDKAARLASNKVLSKLEGWEKASQLESVAVHAQAAIETASKRSAVLSALKDQAAQADGVNRKSLYICDEAGMSGQNEFNRVINSTEQQGAKTVFLGDKLQHQAVDAGKGFELAQKHMPMSVLSEKSIRRQTTDHAKDAVSKILKGEHREAMKGLYTKEFSTTQSAVRARYEAKTNHSDREKAEFRGDLKEAAKADNREVISNLAKDYCGMDRTARDSTLIITSTNADRQAINAAVRDSLKGKGELQDGKRIDVLVKTDNTKEDLKRAATFEKSQIVEFTSKSTKLGIEKGERTTVLTSDSRTNLVTAQTESGRVFKFDPAKLQGKELYEMSKGKEFAVGDKISFTKNDKGLDVKNGQLGSIEKIESGKITAKMASGQTREFDTLKYKHIDHAYAVTSYKSQGQTIDRVMKHHNTEGGQHGDRETYVDVTRARKDVIVYTQNADKAAMQSGAKLDKEVAIPNTERSKSSAQVIQRQAAAQSNDVQIEKATRAKTPERDRGMELGR
jgi:conjugative relaxase-like TrwC/TraI family protein